MSNVLSLSRFLRRDLGRHGHDEEERKSLNYEHRQNLPDYDPHEATEAYLLNHSLQRTNFWLKIGVGLLTILVLILLWLQGHNRKVGRSTTRLIPSPVPPRMSTPCWIHC
jgi:hypothetical protein